MTQHRKQAWSKWRKLIVQQSRNGQSVAAFCRECGLCAALFFAWRKRLAQAAAARKKLEKFVEVKVGARIAAAVPSVVVDPAIEILREDRHLRVREGFDAQHLPAVLIWLAT